MAPDTQKPDLNSRVREWLTSQGYPLEMAAARILQSAGFNTIQSDYYADPDTGEAREIDLVASMQRELDDLYVRVTFVIECKVSKDKPWLIFTSREAGIATPALMRQRAASPAGHLLLEELATDSRFGRIPLIQSGACPGYGLTEAFTQGQDRPYIALMSAAKAATARARSLSLKTPIAEIIFPVALVDGHLVDCSLRNDTLEVAEISRGVLLWRNPIVGMPHTIINVVTYPAFKAFVADARATADFVLAHDKAIDASLKERARRLRQTRFLGLATRFVRSFPFA